MSGQRLPGGSVYRDRDRWVAALDVGLRGDLPRIRKRRVVSIPNPSDPVSVESARERAVRALVELRRAWGVSQLPGDVTVGDYLQWWLEERVSQQLADGEIVEATWEGYEIVARLHVAPAPLARMQLAQIGPRDVHEWQRWLAAHGRTPARRASALGALSTALRWAQRMELVDRNVADLIDAPAHRPRQGRALTLDQAHALAAGAGRLRHAYTTMMGLGLRCGECLGLSWGDIDLDAGVAHIGWQVQREGTGERGSVKEWVRRLPKDKEARWVPLPGFVRDALAAQQEAQVAERAAAERWGGWDGRWALAFTSRDGGPVHETSVVKRLARDCKQLGLPPFTPHDLRRTASSLLASFGVPTRVRMEILGHRTPSLTETVYTRAYDPDIESAMAAFDRAWRAT